MARTDIDRVTITNHLMFSRVFSDPSLARELIEIILGIQIERVELVVTEKAEWPSLLSHGVRYDVYVKDGNGVAYDVEMQAYDLDDLPKRCRYYQSVLDYAILSEGEDYNKLPPSFVIFICTFDPFKRGLARYTFHTECAERDLRLEDEREAVFLNAAAEGRIDDPAGMFLSYIIDGEVRGDDFVRRVDTSVRFYRKEPSFREDYMNVMDDIRYARMQGREEGRAEGREEGRAEGREEGRAEGREEGRAEGREEEAQIIAALVAAGRAEDYLAAREDPKLRRQLLEELGFDAPSS